VSSIPPITFVPRKINCSVLGTRDMLQSDLSLCVWSSPITLQGITRRDLVSRRFVRCGRKEFDSNLTTTGRPVSSLIKRPQGQGVHLGSATNTRYNDTTSGFQTAPNFKQHKTRFVYGIPMHYYNNVRAYDIRYFVRNNSIVLLLYSLINNMKYENILTYIYSIN